ncbi:hypothetical protein KRR40_39000 [Niabella defluvii]|nr:hypothetical protein KRR40_39000 [Niabella sp. I65]
MLELINEVINSAALPLTIENRNTELGRFTAPVAHMLKAKVLVFWASPLFNGNRDYSGFVNHDNEPFFNQQYNAARWDSAANACKRAIQVCTEAGIRLYKDQITRR